jgi:hypothetical protein
MFAITLVGTIFCASAFIPVQINRGNSNFKLRAISWQEELDQFLNIDTACNSRREILGNLLSKTQDIVGDVVSAVQDNDIKKIAPPSLGYGKAVVGLQAVRRQFLSDILPGALTRGIPKLIEEGPKILQELVSKGPEKGQDIFKSVQEISQDPSQVQTLVDDLRRELKNVVKSTPDGLDGPSYDVMKDTETYQVRRYSSYSVCSTPMSGSEGSEMPDPLATGNSFSDLADYIFGEKLSMTTPVILGGGAMEFVLPSGVNAATAPAPKSEKITIKDVPAEVLAVREFPGFATDGEVSRQRAMLEDALLADGVIYDNLSFKVFQYNPPYTLPWLRRNEVTLSIDMVMSDIVVPEEINPELIFSPEAGE